MAIAGQTSREKARVQGAVARAAKNADNPTTEHSQRLLLDSGWMDGTGKLRYRGHDYWRAILGNEAREDEDTAAERACSQIPEHIVAPAEDAGEYIGNESPERQRRRYIANQEVPRPLHRTFLLCGAEFWGACGRANCVGWLDVCY